MLTVSAIDNNKTDLQKRNLRGNVKVLQTLAFEVIEIFGSISKDKRRNSKYESDATTTFSRDGNIIETTLFAADGSRSSRTIFKYNNKREIIEKKTKWEKRFYKYDTKGSMIEEVWDNRDNKFDKIIIYLYDSDGKMIESKSYDFSKNLLSKSFFEYNHNGNVASINWYNKYNLINKTIFKYDNKKNKIATNSFYPDGILQSVNKYNIEGKILENHAYHQDSAALFKYFYKYNFQGDLVEIKYYKADAKLDYLETYEYEYDKEHNWIRKVEYKNNIAKVLFERKIEYYD